MRDTTTIGVFDSGIGGLSMVAACEGVLPLARILYVADTAHQPYGQKTTPQVLDYSRRICDFLVAQGAQAILVACSTVSAVAVPALKKIYSIPIVGLLDDPSSSIRLLSTQYILRIDRHTGKLDLQRSGAVEKLA